MKKLMRVSVIVLFLAAMLATCSRGGGTNPTPTNTATAFAYVANYGSNDISQYTIDANGALTPMTPATVLAGKEPSSITVDPSGKYAYVANWGNDNISQFTIGLDGYLAAMSPATVAAGINPGSVTVDPSGKYAYVANENGGTVSQYTIGANGALTPMTPATFSFGSGSGLNITVNPSGKYAYQALYVNPNFVTSFTQDYVLQYTVDVNGALTLMTPAMVAGGGGYPVFITVDPSGQYAYVTNNKGDHFDGSVSQFSIGASGALTLMTPATVATGTNPGAVITMGSYQ